MYTWIKAVLETISYNASHNTNKDKGHFSRAFEGLVVYYDKTMGSIVVASVISLNSFETSDSNICETDSEDKSMICGPPWSIYFISNEI